MNNFKSMILILGALFMIQNSYGQKGKISTAQLSLEEGKVMEAKKDIDAALMDLDVQKMVKAWNTKGNVYKQIYESKIYYAQNPNCLFESKDAYMKAYELETNPKKLKDVVEPLTMLSGYLFNEGLNRFNAKNYEDSYVHFNASRGINEFLFAKGYIPSIDTNTIYATAMSGVNCKNTDVQPLLERLVEMDYNNAVIYETLAQLYEGQKNKDALDKLITKGLIKYPKNKNLQIYELNATLDNTDVQQSIDKFEKALLNDATNSSILFNLGVLYDKIQNQEKTKECYQRAIALKSDYGDAYFNLGVLYFNDGVAMNKKMNAVDDNVDRDGSIYDGFKKQRDELFLKALPNLEKAYSINPDNIDYKANLKKVYASMNMLEKAKALGE